MDPACAEANGPAGPLRVGSAVHNCGFGVRRTGANRCRPPLANSCRSRSAAGQPHLAAASRREKPRRGGYDPLAEAGDRQEFARGGSPSVRLPCGGRRSPQLWTALPDAQMGRRTVCFRACPVHNCGFGVRTDATCNKALSTKIRPRHDLGHARKQTVLRAHFTRPAVRSAGCMRKLGLTACACSPVPTR